MLMDVLSGCEDGGRVLLRQLDALDISVGWMTHTCPGIVLGVLPYAAAVTVDGCRPPICV